MDNFCKTCGVIAIHKAIFSNPFDNDSQVLIHGCDQHFSDIISSHIVIGLKLISAVSDVKDQIQIISVQQPAIETTKVVSDINEEGKLRAVIDEALAKEAGFSLAPPVWAIGTSVNETGIKNFKRSREEYENLPLTIDAMDSLIDRVKSEGREEAIISSNEIMMLPNGLLTRTIDKKIHPEGYKISVDALVRFLSLLSVKKPQYLEYCPAILRAINVNHWTMGVKARDVKLRLRKNTDEDGNIYNEVFGVTSPGYTSFDTDIIASIVRDNIPEDARAEVIYDGIKSKISILFHTDVKPEDCVAGEIFKLAVIITTNDVGGGAIDVRAAAYRNLCKNLIIIDVATKNVAKKNHIGDVNEIYRVVEAGIRNAYASVKPFAEKWSSASKESLQDITIDLEHEQSHSAKFSISEQLFIAGLMNGLIERELVTVTGNKKEAINNLVDAWGHEPQMTRTGLVNGITRYAHESSQLDPFAETILEEQAGNILFQKKPLPWLQVQW